MSQEELGELLGVTGNYVYMIESGKKRVDDHSSLVKLFDLLDKSPLYRGAEIEQSQIQGRVIHTPLVVAEDAPYSADPRSLLRHRREEMQLSPEDLAKLAKVPAAYIRQIESGEVQGSNEKSLRKLAGALKLPAEAFLSGSDHPPIIGNGGGAKTFGAVPDVDVVAPGGIQAKNIPLISMAQAGDLHSYEDVYDYEGVIEYAKRGPKTFAVRIRGDSMEPRYPDGTIAIVEPDKPLQTERRVITKLRDGSVLFKQLQFQGDIWRLVSLNPLYAPIVIKQHDFEWMYRVVRTQREEED